MPESQELVSLLKKAHAFIGYTPLADEPQYRPYLLASGFTQPEFQVPMDAAVDPFSLAEQYSAEHSGKRVALFIPGRKFAPSGVRAGRGVGWYDRLLSKVPPDWVRVGVAHPWHLFEHLEKKEWDQDMDFILIEEEDGYDVIKTSARTRA